jgi:ABC-type bacteriocin/lantibiotic exporter with double-glycine peptidase domain
MQTALKYVLLVYQGWISESVIRVSRDQLATIAAHQASKTRNTSGQIVNVIGGEIDSVGGFIGTSISEFVVNLSFLVVISGYMLYIQPLIALVSLFLLIPQVLLTPYLQAKLNLLFEHRVGLVRRLGDEVISHAACDRQKTAHEFRTIQSLYRNRISFYILKFGLKSLLNLANALGPLTILVIGGYMVIYGETTMGTIVAFVSGLERLSSPLRDLLNFYREAQQAKVQHQMIVRWMRQ